MRTYNNRVQRTLPKKRLDGHDESRFFHRSPHVQTVNYYGPLVDHHSPSLSLPSSPGAFGGSSSLSLRSMRTRTGALAVYPRMRSVNNLVRER
jgi:hypothetical protein